MDENSTELISTLQAALPAAHRKHLDTGLNPKAKMMAAKGLVPLPPREMILVLCGLLGDADAQVAEAAEAGLTGLPDTLVLAALGGALPGCALELLATRLLEREKVIERLILHRDLSDAALASIAAKLPAQAAGMVAANQERCLRSSDLVRAIASNPNVERSELDRMFEFLARSGVILDGLPQFADALERLSPEDLQAVASAVAMPEGIEAFEAPPEEPAKGEETPALDSAATSTQAAAPKPQAAQEPEEEEERIPLQKLINGMNVAQKLAMALKGNKEARTILLRDTNKLVSTAVIRSPRLTQMEVIAAAQSRSVADEVIRMIAGSKQMTRAYAVRVALVNNPKTPLPVAMRFLLQMRQADLKTLMRSRGVPAALTQKAKQLLQGKMSGK